MTKKKNEEKVEEKEEGMEAPETIAPEENVELSPEAAKLEEIKAAVAWVTEMEGDGNVNTQAQAFQKIKELLK